MYFLFNLIDIAAGLFILAILIQVAVSWMIAFDVINTENSQAKNLIALLKKITDPVYKPVRKYIPPIGGIDLTPLIVIIGIQIILRILASLLFSY